MAKDSGNRGRVLSRLRDWWQEAIERALASAIEGALRGAAPRVKVDVERAAPDSAGSSVGAQRGQVALLQQVLRTQAACLREQQRMRQLLEELVRQQGRGVALGVVGP